MGRQLMYYWTILHKKESELVKNVFCAQRDFPSEGDWFSEVQGVLKKCNINLTEEEISKMSHYKFKKIVKDSIQLQVMSYLVTLQNKHTKSEQLNLETKMQNYLTSSELSLSQKKMLFRLRSKMLKIKANFSAFYNDVLTCSLCGDINSCETEMHLLSCPKLMEDKNLKTDMEKVSYRDVFGKIVEQKKAVEVFTRIMKIYEKKQSQKG